MKETLIALADRFGGFVIGGLIGAIIQRIRTVMSFKEFLGVLAISAFVGFCVGVFLKNYFNAPADVINALCSLAGVFSKDILNQIEKVISYISLFAKKKADLEESDTEEI